MSNTSMKDKWELNEQLLQSYRGVFISSQSFMLAVGAIVWGKDKDLNVFGITCAVGIGMIWLMWFGVVRARHKIVDYYKYGSNLKEILLKKKLKAADDAQNGADTPTATAQDEEDAQRRADGLLKSCTEAEYVKNSSCMCDELNNIFFEDVSKLTGFRKQIEKSKRHWRLTRLKIDFFLPLAFTYIWIVLAASAWETDRFLPLFLVASPWKFFQPLPILHTVTWIVLIVVMVRNIYLWCCQKKQHRV